MLISPALQSNEARIHERRTPSLEPALNLQKPRFRIPHQYRYRKKKKKKPMREAPEAAAEPVEALNRRSSNPKRKSTAPNTTISSCKRLEKEKPTQSPHAPRNQLEEEPSAGAVESVPAFDEEEEDERKSLEKTVEEELKAARSRSANVHVIPTPAGWFSWARIHSLEERAFASFFNGKSEDQTPNVYMEIRNAIMKKFRMDPQSRVEPNDLVGLSIGNSEARQQVMEFLDHWGLINFQPFPLLDSTISAANVDEVAKTASLIEKLYHFQEVQLCPRAGSETNISEQTLPSQLLPESPISENLLSPDGLAVEYHCNACSTDCSKKRYHCQTKADFDLCSECYNDGKFGFGMVPADFILMENAEVPGSSGGNWTDQETLLLLEALELYGEDWNEIADHVATKTKEQCILYFVQMPIEDSFLDGEDSNNAGNSHQIVDPVLSIENLSALDAVETSKKKNEANGEQPVLLPSGASERKDAVSTNVAQVTSDDFAISALVAAFRAVGYRPSKGEPFSFSEAGNQVMALALFLSGLVEPDAAAAWTQSSLKAMSEDSPNIQLASRHCLLLEDPPTANDPLVCERNAGENDTKPLHNKNKKKCNLLEGRDDHETNRIKHAALTALSAAAVKAKLLANQEEDEIRELVSLLIEKQLHKLESKLALSSEMESAILKVREQLDRERQRLYQECAQIVAARLGSCASRSMPLSLATSIMNYGNSGLKPPTVSPQKPTVKRTARASLPSPSPGTAAGYSGYAIR